MSNVKQEIKKDEAGKPYYDDLPEGFRLANLDDFFDASGKWRQNMPYLVYAPISNVYYAERTPKFANHDCVHTIVYFDVFVLEEEDR